MDIVTVDTVKKEARKLFLNALFVVGLIILTLGMGFKALMWTAGKLVTPKAVEIYKSVYTTTTQTYRKYYAEFPFIEKESSDTDPSIPDNTEPSDTTTVAVSDGIMDVTIVETETKNNLDGKVTDDPASKILLNLGIRELKKLAPNLEIKSYSTMTKQELLTIIYYKRFTMEYDTYLKLVQTAEQSKEVEPTNENV